MNPLVVMFDIGSLWHHRCVNDKLLSDKNTKVNYRSVFYSILHEYNKVDSINDILNVEEFLQFFLEKVENKMMEIVSQYSFHELLFWTRRISPINIYPTSEMTVHLYRETLNNVIMKYASGLEDFTVISNEAFKQLIPSYIAGLNPLKDEVVPKVRQVLSDSYLLESLSYFYIYGTQRLRIFNKGGKIVNNFSLGFDVVPQNEEINFLIQLYDDRRDKNTLFSAVGTYFDNNIVKNNVLYALFLQLNVDLKKSFPFDLDLQSSNLFKPNYIPFIISLDKYYEYINLFNVEFKNKFGFSTKDFVVFISALTLHALYSFEKYHCYRYALLQRAYTVYDDKNALLDGICEIATSLYSKKFGYLPKDLNLYINKIFKYLTCERNAPRDISLWTRGPRKIFYPIDNNRGIIDYSGMLSVLETLMLPLSRLDGEAGNKRSIHFENETNDLVKKTFGLDCYWIGQKKINNGKGEEREIDSSFFIREFLFLLECKSVNVSFAFDMGDKRALEFRKEKIKRAFDELNDKVDFIVKNRKCLSYPIPQNIKYIIPIVVSPFAEYIWEKSDNLFISENLPRVLTPNELGEIKEFKDLSFLINKPFTTILPD